MKTVYLLHGIRVRDPLHSSISGLSRFMTEAVGLRPVIMSYGFMPAILANLFNGFLGKRLSKGMEPGSVGVGHSNGCTLMWKISRHVYLRGLVLINPALDPDVEFDPRLDFIHVYYSSDDEITWLSSLVPFSSWGKMGTVGYKGNDPRVKQFDMGVEHTDIGKPAILQKFGPAIVAEIVAALHK